MIDVASKAMRDADLVNALFKAPTPNAANNTQGFGSFMADRESRMRDTVSETRERDTRGGNESNQGRTQEAQRSREDLQQRRSQQPNETTEAGGEMVEAEVILDDVSDVQETPADYESNDESTETEEAIVYNLAEAIQVPPEVVYATLEELEIKPEELAKPPEANKYLQAVLKVETPVEVLTMPEYQDTLNQLTEAVVEILETQTPAEAKPNLEKLQGLVVTIDEEKNLVVALSEEELKVEAVAEEDELAEMLDKDNAGNRQASTNESQAFKPAQQYVETEAPVVAEAPEVLLQDTQSVNPNLVASPATLAAQQIATINATNEIAAAAKTDPTQVMEQIMSKVKTVSAENFAELRINLKPEHLGDVTLRIAVQNGIVMAMFVAESQRVKEIIESNFNLLRDALAEQGIEVGDLFVSVNSEDAEEQMNQYMKAQQEAMRRLQRAAGLTGEAEVEEEPVEEEIKMNNTVSFTA